MDGPDSTARQLDAMRDRIDALEAIHAIQDLKARYAELVDSRYRNGQLLPEPALTEVAGQIATLFTRDATWDGGPSLGVAIGREEIAARLGEPTLAWSWHLFAKPRIEVTGDRATGRWDVLAPCTTRDGQPHWMLGVEDDTYVRVDGTWLHHSMTLRVVFFAPRTTGWSRIGT